jgi:hypothetical protein
VCAKNEKKGTYLIVGAVGTEQEFNSSQKEKCAPPSPTVCACACASCRCGVFTTSWPANRNFGRSFREAASRTGARIAHFGFDSSVVEVMADDIHKFIEYIQWRMKGKIQH